jgi:hypothetical protein
MPRFSIRHLMTAVAITALLISDPRIALVLLILAGSIASLQNRYRRRWAVPYFVTLACVYLPFSWLVLTDYPWGDYRWFWIKLWPVLPGLPAGMFFHPNDSVEFFVSGIVTVGVVVLLTRVGASGRKSLIVTNGIALILAAMDSFIAYQLFRA